MAPKQPQAKCGPHVDLIENAVVRVARCPCGTVHLHLQRHGVSVRLDGEQLRHLSNALAAASRMVDIVDDPVPLDDTVN